MRGREGKTFPREIMLLSATDTLRKTSGGEWLLCHEKEKLLACQESQAKAVPRGLLGAHPVLLLLWIRGPVSELELASNGLVLHSVIMLFLRLLLWLMSPVCLVAAVISPVGLHTLVLSPRQSPQFARHTLTWPTWCLAGNNDFSEKERTASWLVPFVPGMTDRDWNLAHTVALLSTEGRWLWEWVFLGTLFRVEVSIGQLFSRCGTQPSSNT